MTDFEKRFNGFEFDWFALDLNDNLAILASAGMGTVPIDVQNNFRAYDTVYPNLHLPNLGSMKIWEDFATYGFYVFDWKMNGGPYIKMSDPIREMTPDLKQQILEIKGLPRLQINFQNVSEINFI